ncbi:MAG: hypothetical protein GXP63_06035 [DPANN group archaeon]|nr:hypothetical protein [DPANN group archaeon]
MPLIREYPVEHATALQKQANTWGTNDVASYMQQFMKVKPEEKNKKITVSEN